MYWGLIVTYDLAGSGRNYNRLYRKIQSYELRAHISQSSWILFTDKELGMVYDHLVEGLNPDDKLFVGEVSGATWQGLPDEVSDWMQEI